MVESTSINLTDWNAFVDSLNQLLLNGVTAAEVSAQLGDREVRWDGQLVEVKTGPNRGRAIINVGKRKIETGGTSDCFVSNLVIPIRKCENLWEDLEVGSTISFAAVFAPGEFVFPAFSISELPDNLFLAEIRFVNGVPVSG